jgi:hypothetical protein
MQARIRASIWRRPAVCLAAVLVAVAAHARDEALGPREDVIAPSPRARVVSESEFAGDLLEALGLDHVLPEEHGQEDVLSLLCPERAERAVESEGRRLPVGPAFEVRLDSPRAARAGAPLRMVVPVPASALYTLVAHGAGRSRFAVDRAPVGELELSVLGADAAPQLVPLARGPHEIEVRLGARSEVERVELLAFRSLCIAPAGGWNPSAPLRFGAKARSMVRAMGLEGRLPVAGEPLVVEAEGFETGPATARTTDRELGAPASERLWATADGGPAELAWRIVLPEPGLYTVMGRVHGSSPQLWSVDSRHTVRVIPGPEAAHFDWSEVVTLPLDAGEHVIRARIADAAGIDVLHLVPRRAGDHDYLDVLRELGFDEGAPDQPVSQDAARANLSHPAFRDAIAGLLTRLSGVPGDPLLKLERALERRYQRPLSPVLPGDL